MTVSNVNNSLFTVLSALNGQTLSTLSAINGQTILAVPCTQPTWTGITNATNVGGVLTKTSANNWDMGAVSVETQAGDCRFVYYVEDVTKQYMFGIGADSTCTTFSTIDRAFFINFTGYGIYENGVDRASGGSGISKLMVVIERIGTNVNYYSLAYTTPRPQPNDPGRTLLRGPIVSSGSTFYINVAIFSLNGVVDAALTCWNSL